MGWGGQMELGGSDGIGGIRENWKGSDGMGGENKLGCQMELGGAEGTGGVR